MTPKTHTFVKRSEFNTTLEKLIEFHQHPKAFGKLTPPPIFMQVHRDDRASLTEGEIEFTLWFGIIPVRWVARHEPGPNEHSFADRMIKGPLAYWHHEHIFEATERGAALTDRVTLAHQPGFRGLLTRLTFDGVPLRFLFAYRHWKTRRATR